MILHVNTAGSIVFTIAPIVPTDDYDFAVIDITNSSCSTFTPNDVIRCNFNNNLAGSNINGVVGLNSTSTSPFTLGGATGGSFNQQVNANAGDVYLIMINNFGIGTTPTSGFTIDFTGSTATFNGTNPSMDNIIPSCNSSQQITLQMNTNVLCNSIEPGGSDFTVSGGGSVVAAIGANCANPNGYTKTLLLNFASPLPPGTYTLGVKNGLDGNTILDICNVPLATTDTIQFVIDPYVPPAFVSIDTPACSEIRIKMNTRIRCDSIAADGSDFAISGPQANSVVAAYGTGCDTLNFTDTVVLILQSPLQTDGVYSITAKKGTDGNTTMDSCGLYQPIGNEITLTINAWDGLLVALPDTVLCEGQYLQLQVNNYSVPPAAPVECGIGPMACNGNMRVAFAGTNDSSTAVNTPFSGASQDARAQYIYQAEELRAMGLKAGMITTLEWKVTKKLSTIPFDNFTVKVGCTPISDLNTDFIVTAQTVYTTPSYSSVTGWNTFNLTTPYNWDGVSNLVVEVCYDNSAVSANDEVAHSATSFSSVMRRFGSGFSGCAITTQGSSQTSSTMRPRLRFYICEPPAGTASFAWTPGTLLSDSTIQQPLAFINKDVRYEVMVTDRYGCAHKDSFSVTVSIREPLLTPIDTVICLKERVPLLASGGVNYSWIATDPSTLSCISCPNPVASPVQNSVYSVIISDQYNCADTLTSTITVNPLPVINILPDEALVKYGTTIQLLASGGYLYSWTPPSVVSDPNIVNPIATITGPKTIILTGIDENGCRNTDSLHVGVDYRDPIFIPSAFSPNGDGKNDIFKIGSITFQKLLEFRVFNRWGEEVYSTTDPSKGWDGRFKGVPQEIGLYHYLIRVAYPDSKVETYKGDVTLVK
jgi:gliding motility-associated-like protein